MESVECKAIPTSEGKVAEHKMSRWLPAQLWATGLLFYVSKDMTSLLYSNHPG